MTKQEAISLLEGEIIRCRMAPKINGCPMTDEWKRTIEVCEIAIDAIRAQEERWWIPVTERLPNPFERVLATDGGFVGEFYVNIRGQWQRYNVNDYSLLMALDILWWMPLPQPPKGE